MFFAETRLGWVPFWLEHADLWYQRHIGWAESMLGFKPLKRLPSEYVREHIYFTVQYERVAIELRQHVGVDHIMFATDFPHIECEWPNSRPLIDKIYADVPDGGTGPNLGRKCGGIFQTYIDFPRPASATVEYASVIMGSDR